jgi:hypothetical protein
MHPEEKYLCVKKKLRKKFCPEKLISVCRGILRSESQLRRLCVGYAHWHCLPNSPADLSAPDGCVYHLWSQLNKPLTSKISDNNQLLPRHTRRLSGRVLLWLVYLCRPVSVAAACCGVPSGRFKPPSLQFCTLLPYTKTPVTLPNRIVMHWQTQGWTTWLLTLIHLFIYLKNVMSVFASDCQNIHQNVRKAWICHKYFSYLADYFSRKMSWELPS